MENKDIETKSPELFLLDDPQQELVESVEKFFGGLILGHTRYQIKNFIIGQFHTPDRKHRQCIQELHKRFRGVVQFHYDYKNIQIEIEEQQLKLKGYRRDLQEASEDKAEYIKLAIRRAENEIEIRLWNQGILKRSLRETLREMSVFKEESDRIAPHRKFDNYEYAEPVYWETQYTMERLKGKRGDKLPNIPNKPEIENLIKNQIEQGKKEIQVDRMLETREVINHA